MKFKWTMLKKVIFAMISVAGVSSIMATSPPDEPVEINLFEVRPEALCSEGIVDLTWETGAHTARIDQFPHPSQVIDNLDSLAPSGAARAYLTEDTSFTLHALPDPVSVSSYDNYTSRNVTMIPAGGRNYTLETFGKCSNGSPEWRISKSWAEGAHVAAVQSLSKDTITITHGSFSVDMEPSQTVTEPFAGQVMSGDWILTPHDIPDHISSPCGCPEREGAVCPSDYIGISLKIGVIVVCQPN